MSNCNEYPREILSINMIAISIGSLEILDQNNKDLDPFRKFIKMAHSRQTLSLIKTLSLKVSEGLDETSVPTA